MLLNYSALRINNKRRGQRRHAAKLDAHFIEESERVNIDP
jgi:hypothetical protein